MDLKFQSDGCIFSCDEIQVDPEVSTVILSVHSQYSDHILNSLAESLKQKRYEVRSSLRNKTTLSAAIFYEGSREGTIDSHYVCLVASMSCRLYGDLTEILKSDFGYFRQTVCRVPHTDKEERLDDGVSARTVSGIIRTIDEMVPFSVFLMYEDGLVIAKALLKYHNSEMGEYEPAVVAIEVSDDRQERSGIFLKHLEDKLREYGFVKLWVMEIQNESFWKKNGYQIIDRQGVKYLIPATKRLSEDVHKD